MKKKLKISLVELHGHLEVLHSLCLALDKYYHIYVFTTLQFIEFEPRPINVFALSCKMTETEFLIQNSSIINNSDYIIFITIENNFKFYANHNWKAKTIMLIHNGNYWFNYSVNEKLLSFKDFLRYLKSKIYRHQHFKAKLLNRIDYVTFPNDVISEYFKQDCSSNNKMILPSLPFYLPYKFNFKEKVSNEIIILIPGTVNVNLRNYNTVLQAFKIIINQISKFLNLVFLGKNESDNGKKLLIEFANLKNKFMNVITFEHEVSHLEYENWLSRTDFLILPLKRNIRFGICQEIGGLTKISGTINDMLRYKLPAMIDSEYSLEPYLETQVLKYDRSEDLALKLLDWINNGVPSFPNLSLPSSENWRDRFESNQIK